uniref:Uncharacterized protein n=1 Tax=Anopheles minimus TaxID=112268 RepID=A0A182WQ85_9DIPT
TRPVAHRVTRLSRSCCVAQTNSTKIQANFESFGPGKVLRDVTCVSRTVIYKVGCTLSKRDDRASLALSHMIPL